VITFLILTGETLFKDQSRLGQYVFGSFEFPSDVLRTKGVSGHGCEFVRSLMAVNAQDRSGAKECLRHRWLESILEDVVHEAQRYYASASPPEYSTCVVTLDAIVLLIKLQNAQGFGVIANTAKIHRY
jgi:hypothetical protein